MRACAKRRRRRRGKYYASAKTYLHFSAAAVVVVVVVVVAELHKGMDREISCIENFNNDDADWLMLVACMTDDKTEVLRMHGEIND